MNTSRRGIARGFSLLLGGFLTGPGLAHWLPAWQGNTLRGFLDER